jgi:hypothetical protein
MTTNQIYTHVDEPAKREALSKLLGGCEVRVMALWSTAVVKARFRAASGDILPGEVFTFWADLRVRVLRGGPPTG